MAWSFSSEQTDTVGAFESCEEKEAGEEEGAANEGAPSDEGEASGRTRHLHAIASHPQREQRVTESSVSDTTDTHTPTPEVPRRTSVVRNLRRPWAPREHSPESTKRKKAQPNLLAQ